MKLLQQSLVLIICLFCPGVYGDVITFQDKNAFRNATSGNVVIDFEGLVADTNVEFVPGQSLTLSGTTFRSLNGSMFLAGANAYQDTSVLTVQNAGNSVGKFLSIILPQPVWTVGVDLSTPLAGQDADFHFQLSNGDALVTTSGRLPTFFGLISSTPFASLTIRSFHVDSTSMEIDNFEFASTAAVPEPSSMILLTTAIGCLWLKKKRCCSDS